MAGKVVKAMTKGQKQIVDDNRSTLRFYTIMSMTAMFVYLLVIFFVCDRNLSIGFWFSILFSGAVYSGSGFVLNYMARPVYSSTGALIDGGTDLNMENGFAENVKDLVILTAGVQTLSTISNYFWFLWLFAPMRAFYMLWVNILGPWFFQSDPQQQQPIDDKKQKKLERKMKRIQ